MADQRTHGSVGARGVDEGVARIAGVALSRRRLLRGGGMLLGAAALSPVLAACGSKSPSSAATEPSGSGQAAAPAAPTVAAPAAPTTAAAAAGGTTVTVKAHEAGDLMLFDVDKQMVPAGNATFNFTNTGKMTHELMVYPVQDIAEMLAKRRTGAEVEEDEYIKGMVGAAEDIDPGKSASFSGELKPGFYELACHMQGKNPDGSTFLHFDRGQTMTLAVTGPGGPSESILEPSDSITATMDPGKGELSSSWLFNLDSLVAKSGKVTFKVTNNMDMEHDFIVYPLGNISDFIKGRVESEAEDFEGIKAQVLAEDLPGGDNLEATADLTPGWWVAMCSALSTLPDGTKYIHRDRGQRVTFLVQ